MLSFEEVKKIAHLARLGLSEEELKGLTKDIDEVLNYVKQLQEVDTKDVEPMAGGTFLENVWREDIPESPNERDLRLKRISKILDQIPRRKADYFEVPKIIEK